MTRLPLCRECWAREAEIAGVCRFCRELDRAKHQAPPGLRHVVGRHVKALSGRFRLRGQR